MITNLLGREPIISNEQYVDAKSIEHWSFISIHNGHKRMLQFTTHNKTYTVPSINLSPLQGLPIITMLTSTDVHVF